jgi:hypothetical protein
MKIAIKYGIKEIVRLKMYRRTKRYMKLKALLKTISNDDADVD